MRAAAAALKVLQGAAVLGIVCVLFAKRSDEVAALHRWLLEFDGLRFLMSHVWTAEPAAQAAFALAWLLTCVYFLAATAFGAVLLLSPAATSALPGPLSVRAVRRGFPMMVFLVPPRWISAVASPLYSGIREERMRESEKRQDAVLSVAFPPERLAGLRTADVVFTIRPRGAGTERCLAIAGVSALLAAFNGYVLFAWPFRFGTFGSLTDGIPAFLVLSWCFCGSLCGIALTVCCALLKASPVCARGPP